MGRFSETEFLVKAGIGAAFAIVGVMAFIWWHRASEDRKAQADAMPGCIEKLGSREVCERHMSEHHRECFAANFKGGGRFSQSRSFDQAGYLDCIVVGAEPWEAARRQAREQIRRGERADGISVR